jgi:hypothetical protein
LAQQFSDTRPALHLIDPTLNHAATPLTYIMGWGTEVSHDEASNDHQSFSEIAADVNVCLFGDAQLAARSACLPWPRSTASLKYAQRDRVHSAMLRVGP